MSPETPSPSSIAVVIGLPDLLPPSSLKTKRTKNKEKKPFCPPGVGAFHSFHLLRRRLELRFRPPLAPPSVAGASESAPSCAEGAAAPRTLRGGEGDLQPISASQLSHWCPLGVGGSLRGAHPWVWVGRAVIGRRPTKQLPPRCRSRSLVFGSQINPRVCSPPSWEAARPVGTWGCRCRLYHGLFIRPPTDLISVLCRQPAQTVVVSILGSSL